MTIELAYNLSILVAITVVSGFIDDRWRRTTRAGMLAQGLLFGTAAVVGMLRPFVLTSGIFFDGRSMMLSLSALFFGPLAAAVAVPMTLACRMYQGGSGTLMGVSVILTSTAVGLAVRWRRRGDIASLGLLHLLLFGLIVHVVMVALMATLPSGIVLVAIVRLGPIVLGVYPLATVLAGRVLADQEARANLVEGLRRSEEQWRALAANIPGVVYRCEAQPPYRLQYISEGVQNLIGRPASAFTSGRSNWDAITIPDDRDIVNRTLETAASAGTPFELEYRVLHADGSLRWIHEKGQAGRGPQGEVTWLDGVVIDVTGRKRAEEAWRQSETRWQFALEEAGDGVWDWDLATNRVFYSRSWKATLGFEEHEIGNEFAEWDRRVHPDDRGRCIEDFQRHLRGETAIYQNEHRLQCRDGSYKWILDRGKVVERQPDGTPLRMIGTHTDVTDRRQADTDRLEMERRLLHAQKLESLGVLAGGIAHDFNNLLTAILGNLELGLDELAPASPARDAFAQAVQASRRAADLTRQMLAYSGRGQFVFSPLDLSELVRENAGLFRASVGRHVTLDLDLADRLPFIEADPGQVQQVVMNLITNAYEAIGTKAGTVTLTTSERTCDAEYLAASRVSEKPPPGRFVCLEVRDTGCGMDEETRQRLFDPFFTTKFTGRGLGLSALLGIIRGHEGAVLVDSEVGRGSVIRALFPVASRTLRVVGGQDSRDRAAMPRSTGGSARTILVVDDEAAVRQLAERMVISFGFQAAVAEDGHAALKELAARPEAFSCVLLDLTMPGLDGVATFGEIKRIRPNLPVILCSGFSEADATHRFIGAGLAGFLQKPYGLSDLRAKLEALLGPGR
ncbi:MAG TPA: PAS domain-containing protein [Vicinamibacterales bacterium]|jgi:PAS domain S-box-containing protein